MVNKTKLITFIILMVGMTYAISMAGLDIKITPLKSAYLLREPVVIKYQIKNIGFDSTWFWQSDIPLNFIVMDSNNKRYNSNYEVSHLALPPTLRPPAFKPGESIEHTVDLDVYGPLPIGEYRVYLEIEYGTVKISKSNTIQFEIVKPSGKEKQAYDELLTSDSLMRLKNFDAACQKLVEISRKYPASVYAPFGLWDALTTYKFSSADKAKLAELSREFIEKYPNSHYIYSPMLNLLDYYQSKKDKNGFIEELNTLIKKYPESEVSKWAKNRLETIDKLKF